MITIPKGSLSILPSLSPKDGTQADEERIGGKELGQEPRWQFGSYLQGMLLGRVMRDETRTRQGLDARGDQVSLGRVQIAAAGVNPERPGGGSRGLPGGQGERVVEQLRHGGLGDGLRRRERTEQGGVRRRGRGRVGGVDEA